MLGLTGGCSSQTGQLAVRSVDHPELAFSDQFTTAFYETTNKHDLHVILVEGDPDSPTRALHMRMVWQPVAGQTPLDSRATNVTLRFAVFDETGVGIYAGAGFLYLRNKPGSSTLLAELRDASMRLQDKSEGYEDKLDLAVASGLFSAERNPLRVQRVMKRVQAALADQLGHPRFVQRDVEKIFEDLISGEKLVAK